MGKIAFVSIIAILPYCLVVTVGHRNDENVLHTSKQSRVTPLDTITRNQLGVVKGVSSCGGLGKFLEWRYATCEAADQVCNVIADGVARISQLDFIPSTNIKQLGARFYVKSTDGVVSSVFDEGPVNSTVPIEEGNHYTITVPGGSSLKLKGKSTTFQYILYKIENNEVEVCAEAPLNFV